MKHETNSWVRLSAPERIRQALVSLMRERSYNDISITDLCSHAGVSRMAYYRHFKNRQDILLDPLAARLDELYLLSKQGVVHDPLSYWTAFFRLLRRDELIVLILKADLAQKMDVHLIRHAEQMCAAVHGWNMDTQEHKLHVRLCMAASAALLGYALFDDPTITDETLAEYMIQKVRQLE